jgi:hypothetical protein
MHPLWRMILRTSKPPLPMLIFSSTQINVRHFELLENATKSTIHTNFTIPLWKPQIANVTLASGPPPPSHGPNKSSTSAPKPTNPSGIFDGPRSKSRPSLFVGLYILPSFVPTSHTRPKSGLHKLLTSLSVQNAFKDVRQNTYWTYLSSVTSAITIVSQHWIDYLCVTLQIVPQSEITDYWRKPQVSGWKQSTSFQFYNDVIM